MSASEAGRRTPLVVRGAFKAFGSTKALDGLDLEVSGGLVAIVGRNGAGKSTLFRALLDLVRLDHGTVAAFDFDSRRDGLEVRRRVGFLPEHLELPDELSGREILSFAAACRSLGREQVDEVLAAVGLEADADRLAGGCSLGIRKRIGLAIALLGSPPLIVLDEPLNGLDTASMARLRQLLRSRAENGSTIVFSSHVMSFVERLADRVVVLASGQVVADGTADDLRRQAGLEQAPFEDVFLALA